MRVLITGANGFIAAHIATALHEAGHEVICCTRDVPQTKRRFWYAHVIYCDFNVDTSSEIWVTRLQQYQIEAVINCVGVLQASRKQSMDAIHHLAPIALFNACKQVGVKRIIQLSALGAGDSDTEYAESKQAADDHLLAMEGISNLVIRPSIVYSYGSYGGTSLFRGLSALPGFIPVIGNGKQLVAPIHAEDLSKAIVYYLEHPEISNQIIYTVGPEQITMKDLLIKMRRWLGFNSALVISIPLWIIGILAKCGDYMAKSPINSTSFAMIKQDNVHDATAFNQSIPFSIKGFSDGLSTWPSSIQDRWHARLYFIAPILRVVLALMWIASGVVPFFNTEQSLALLTQIGIPESINSIVMYGLCGLDIIIGILILTKWRFRLMGLIQFTVVLIYTLVAIFAIPVQWLNPLGPLIKNIPILLTIVIWTILEDSR